MTALSACLALSTWAASPAVPPVGQWISSSFNGPEDGQLWHSVFYVAAVEQPQSITRHSGLMIRCTAAPLTHNVKVALAFGAVLRSNSRGEVGVEIALDGRSEGKLRLVTRNQANAEFLERGAKSFLQRLLTANTLQFSARLNPKGSAKVAMPLAPGRANITQMLESCGIDLDADAELEKQLIAKARRQEAKPQSTKTESSRKEVPPLARAVAAYLAASDSAELDAARSAIAGLQPSVTTLLAALQEDNALHAEAQQALPGRGNSGVSSRVVDGVSMPFHVAVPAKKAPPQGLPLAIVLHGGVRRPPWRERERWWQDYPFNPLLKDFLVVSPAGWRDARWWGALQQKNLRGLIAQMQRHYAVDESRVFVVGVSDGGAGALSLAMTDATPLAGVVSLIGHPAVLFEDQANKGVRPQFANLTQVPVFMANGGADVSMPQDTLAPWLQSMWALGVPVVSHIEPDMGHELNFSSAVVQSLRSFLASTQRPVAPRKLTWEAGVQQLPSRHRWLVIEALQPGASTGCVTIEQNKNGGYDLRTQGVARLRVLIDNEQDGALLLSVNEAQQPTRLQASPSVETLLRWHAQDANRERFYSTEHALEISTNSADVCKSETAHAMVAAANLEKLREERRLKAEEIRANRAGPRQRDREIFGGGGSTGGGGNTAGGGVPGGGNNSGRPEGDPTRIERPGEPF